MKYLAIILTITVLPVAIIYVIKHGSLLLQKMPEWSWTMIPFFALGCLIAFAVYLDNNYD